MFKKINIDIDIYDAQAYIVVMRWRVLATNLTASTSS